MMNALALLQQKEIDLARIRKETEALRIVAPLLWDDSDELIDTKEERVESFDLRGTGTDGFLPSSDYVFELPEDEVGSAQPFLVPKPTHPAFNFRQRLSVTMQTVLARVRGLSRRWRYAAIAGMLIVIAISGFYLGRRIGHRVHADAYAAHATEAFARQPAPGMDSVLDQTTVAVHSIEPVAQRTSLNPPELLEGDAPGGVEIHPLTSLTLVDSVPLASRTASDAGDVELLMGRRYLAGQGVREDHTKAARWLWKSVAKQNGDAALLLADLFARGDGVPKSCEETRILLSVAATHLPKTGAPEFSPSSQLTSCDQK